MTDPGGILLDRAALEHAFTALGQRLLRRGVTADLFVIGGAAMALAYDAERVTRDVDAMFVPHDIVLEEAALEICTDFFPGETIPPRALGVLDELFGPATG